MLDKSEDICKRIKESGCITDAELQFVEMGLKMIDCYNEMLNQNIGLDLQLNEPLGIDFGLKYAVSRNSYMKLQSGNQIIKQSK